MNTVVAYLNAIIEDPRGRHKEYDDAREALYKIEGHDLAVTALRQVVEHPKNAEALTHASRLLALIDARQTKAAPQAPALAGETAVLPSSDAAAPAGLAEECDLA